MNKNARKLHAPLHHYFTRRGRSGFTLVELVLALGILGITLTTLIFMRLEAIRKITEIVHERELRRLAQELLEEKLALSMENLAEEMGGELDELTGEIENRPGWTWEWLEDVHMEGEEFILEYTLRILYPNPDDLEGEENTYELKTWVLPTEEQLDYIIERQELMREEGIDEFGNEIYGF